MLRLVLVVLLLTRANCEAVYAAEVPDYGNYNRTYLYKYNGTATEPFYYSQLSIPFTLYMHGSFFSSFVVYSRGSLSFKRGANSNFTMNISYGSVVTALEIWHTQDNLTVHYVGTHHVEWFVTFFNGGSNRFLVHFPASNADSRVELISDGHTYQVIDRPGAALYETCALGCFSCLKRCDSPALCRKVCPECYQAGGGGCANMVIVFAVVLTIVLAWALIDTLLCIFKRRCYTLFPFIYLIEICKRGFWRSRRVSHNPGKKRPQLKDLNYNQQLNETNDLMNQGQVAEKVTQVCCICDGSKCDYVSPCRHHYHKRCIRFSKLVDKCPVCRQPIPLREAVRNVVL